MDWLANIIGASTESAGNHGKLRQMLLICFSANALIWLCALLIPSAVSALFNHLEEREADRTIIFLLCIPFILGFLATYSVCRMRNPDIENESSIGTGMMAGYGYRDRQNTRWSIWLFSAFVGGINVLLLCLLHWLRQ